MGIAIVRTTLVLLAIVTGASNALAQNTLFLRDSPIGWMDDQDQAILKETIAAIMAAPDGTATDWLNPESGSQGRLQVLDTHEDLGTTCRNIRMRNEVQGRKGGGVYRLCLAKDGEWRFAPNAGKPPAASADAAGAK